MAKTYFEQLNDINRNVSQMASRLSKGVAKQAEDDLGTAFDKIIDNFYGDYNIKSYKRRNDLYHMLISHSTVKGAGHGRYHASVTVGSGGLSDHFNTDTDNIYDLVWIHGVRGLPRRGTEPLNRSFVVKDDIMGYHRFNPGEVWENPYWDQTEYHNTFRTSITIGAYTTKYAVPNQIMNDLVEHWDLANGIITCDKLVKNL